MFGHDICLKGRLDTFSTFSVFKIHNSVSLWVKITKKPNSTGRPSLCLARKQSSNCETGCGVINRWIIGTRNFAKSWAPPWPSLQFDLCAPSSTDVPVLLLNQPFLSSPARRLFQAWGDFHARSRFARSIIPEEK